MIGEVSHHEASGHHEHTESAGLKRRGIKKQEEAGLIITSLIDIFVIVLVFLLQTVSAEGNLLTSADNLVLPMSARAKSPTEVNLVITGATTIAVDGKELISVEKVRKQEGLLVDPIVALLTKKHEAEKKAEMMGILKDASGKIVVQFDKNTPYDVVTKVMASCGYAGYSNIKFAVMRKNEEG